MKSNVRFPYGWLFPSCLAAVASWLSLTICQLECNFCSILANKELRSVNFLCHSWETVKCMTNRLVSRRSIECLYADTERITSAYPFSTIYAIIRISQLNNHLLISCGLVTLKRNLLLRLLLVYKNACVGCLQQDKITSSKATNDTVTQLQCWSENP
jgi:hypothetical protein